jgi:hypothetical protein
MGTCGKFHLSMQRGRWKFNHLILNPPSQSRKTGHLLRLFLRQT